MKKIFIAIALMMVASCSYLKGDYTLGRRNVFNDFFYTYNIRYYEEGALEDLETETISVSDYKKGAMRHAVPGGVVVSSKIYQKTIYSDEFVRPTGKGAMVSYTVPVEFSDEKMYRAMGETEIDGVTYRLLEPNRLGDVLLIDGRGNIYPRVGRIYNDRLALLKTSFVLEPEGVKFLSETKSRAGEEEIMSGFEIRYQGIEDYQMVFDYINVSPNGGQPLQTEKTYKFPMYDKKIDIEGVIFEVLDINESGIEYKILEI